MDLPELKISARDREFNTYTRDQRERVVIAYLFKGYSHRILDKEILGINSDKSKGYQSMGILHHYGLVDSFKGLFKGMSATDALQELPDDPKYNRLYDIISGDYDIDNPDTRVVVIRDGVGYNKEVLGKIRINQDLFRENILKAYDGSCCITGIKETHMLRASHIKPWRSCSMEEKTDVHNGLCLNALHDCAFDSGLMTVEPYSLKIKLSSKIEESMSENTYDDYFRRYDGKSISVPHLECKPKDDYLQYHLDNIFNKQNAKIKIVYEYYID